MASHAERRGLNARPRMDTHGSKGGHLRLPALARVFLVLLSLAAPPAAAGITLTDDAGRKVVLPAPATRIVTLAPFLTELAFSAGVGAKVVGVSAHSDHPPEAKALPQVSSAVGLAMEPLLALRPQLALAWRDGIRPEELRRLESLGVPVFVTHAPRLEDVPRLMEAIARLAGGDASAAAAAFRDRIAALRQRHAARPKVPVLLEVWHRPLTTIAGAHWMNEALATCGGENAFADLAGIAPVLSWEAVYARDPAVIVGAGSAPDEATFLANWSARPTLSAVRGKRLVFVEADLITRPTARLAEGVARLCEGLERQRGR